MPEQGDFLRRFLPAQQSIYAFVRAAGFDVNEAEDVVQDVALAAWKDFASYDPSLPFTAWAVGIARNITRNRRRYDRVRENVVVQSEVYDQIADCVADAVAGNESSFSREKEYLERCFQELPGRSRALIRLRYADEGSIDKVAQAIGGTYAAANMLLSRIRAALMECIVTKMRRARP